MEVLRVQRGTDGVIQLPQELLDEMNLEDGQSIEVEPNNHSLRFSLSVAERVKRAQSVVRKFVPDGISLVDELIEERRRELEAE